MGAKRAKPKKKASAKKKTRFAVELTRKELLVWLGVGFLAMGWMFTLGVFVGRGLSPVHFDVEKLKKELIALKQKALKREEAVQKRNANSLSKKSSLDFYDLLTDKKEQARLKPSSKTRRQSARQKEKVPSSSKAEPKTASQESFTVQVLSVQDSARAGKLVAHLKKKGYGAYKVTANVPGKGTHYRVRVGHFSDRSKARKAAAKLRNEKLEPFVVSE